MISMACCCSTEKEENGEDMKSGLSSHNSVRNIPFFSVLRFFHLFDTLILR
jgi:hypothetical protein